ncbi:MAG: serine hydrolase domain-containing protein [Chloroflexota bacterium]
MRAAVAGLSLALVAATSGGAGATVSAGADAAFAEVGAEIEQHMAEGGIPSLAAAMVADNEVIWVGGFGEQPASDTVFMVGSIAKAFDATAVLQLHERDLIDLDADVSDYLPFSLRHPEYPDRPITIRMLLTHTSGMSHDLPAQLWWDNDAEMLAWMEEHLGLDLSDYPFAGGLPPVVDYLEYFLAPGAEEGSAAWTAAPGTSLTYSNTAYTLILRYVIEQVSGQTFPAYMEENVFTPLGMIDTGYEAAEFRTAQLATPYTRFDDGDRALPLTGRAASGPLRMTATDLAVFLAAHMNEGSVDGVRLLAPESAEMMHARHVVLSGSDSMHERLVGNGMGWWLWGDGQSGHGGGTPGFLSEMVMQERDAGTVGTVLMVNIGCSLRCDRDVIDAHLVPIRELLLEEAAKTLVTR